MAIDTTGLRSRRALLAGTLGGLAALAAQALGRPAPTHATHADVHLGTNNNATSLTTITNTAGGQAFKGVVTSSTALAATATTGTGVNGYATAGIGIFGASGSVAHAAVYGVSNGNSTGLRGVSGGLPGFESAPKTGVHGYAVQDAGARGVTGQTTVGRGVNGIATTGIALYGESTLGRGGHFKGKKAQIRLDPSTAATHPVSGAAGDIFLDASKRLWLCKGGTTWVRLD